jgi:hypothetical protein
MAHAGKQVLAALTARKERSSVLADAIGDVASHPGCDTIAARRRIADAVIQNGRYPF